MPGYSIHPSSFERVIETDHDRASRDKGVDRSNPVMRRAAAMVRRPGVRMAPTVSTNTRGQVGAVR
jgi:hypothetical protein